MQLNQKNIVKKKQKTKKKFYLLGIEPETSANMDNTWGMGMRSAGTWHLTCVEQSKTVQTISKLMD